MIHRAKTLANQVSPELLFWTFGLGFLFLLNFLPSAAAVDLCPSQLAGIGRCPGCGLGKSISLLFVGNVTGSLEAHFLGPFALLVILSRIFSLTRRLNTINRKEISYGKTDAAAS